ncbi:Flageller protein FlgA [Sulfurimonas denitrificans DSM 1251]|uniref:Flageller protein FlgA n=1 Tax=Sulfurimonas denitrificans (strain ATCC 33889 / DSM 1251) TaxID=326298 RepID=Q30RI0_SULDN|nr:flagellar basal body P-ring formation chaperone FlgA [Sulfurimonas denitrificans]ABB44401.1 Flageller protein FlgA [Sulfurimonas denitrificans DSM 1251]MDD3442984.1 flagellar basal body P-ring formation chaperone FlgA [Sulfurimonas denitrificans]
MFIKILFLPLILLNLYANNALEGVYYVDSKDVKISTVIPHVKSDFSILTIEENRYSQRIKSKEFIELLSKHGYKNYTSKSSYINFILKSPINTSKLEQRLEEYYKKSYENIDIKSIHVEPRGYLSSLPEVYTIQLRDDDFLSDRGVISIKTDDNKKLFFDYNIIANVEVYKSKDSLKKDTNLSPSNTFKKSVRLDRFRDKPLQNIYKTSLQVKRHIQKDAILTIRDVEIADVVKRDSNINVTMHRDGMDITFSAKAQKDAKVNDIINVQNSSGKILKVKVTGSNSAEIE